jgi:hypothetical protein
LSEYQYYEFMAIERPLSEQEMAHMREISSRGRITPVSFSNEYNWGDFKGDPKSLMRRFYDAHVYLANWGSVELMLRLPKEALERSAFHDFMIKGGLEVEATPTHWICSWSQSESEDCDRFLEEDGPGWMARLAPLRQELLRGDLRSLYIGWLAAVANGEVGEDEQEPEMPDGLAPFSAAQEALAEFLDIDPDLLVGVGMDRPVTGETVEAGEIDSWLNSLSPDEMRHWVGKIIEGRGMEAEREVKASFTAWHRNCDAPPRFAPRTVADLWQLAEKAQEVRRLRDEERHRQEQARKLRERDAYLAGLARDFPKAWQGIEQRVRVGSGKAYDEVCRALVDLAEAYTRHARRDDFTAELRRFMTSHMQRKTLVQRLVKAGLMRG